MMSGMITKKLIMLRSKNYIVIACARNIAVGRVIDKNTVLWFKRIVIQNSNATIKDTLLTLEIELGLRVGKLI